MGSTDEKTSIIAAEAAHDIGRHPLWNTEDRANRIKSAIEKAVQISDENWQSTIQHWGRGPDESRAAHASEQGAIAKLLSALREIASYDLNCAHETIAQAAIEDYEKSQRPTPATVMP